MLAIIWLEIIMKHYDELCHKISRSSLPLKQTQWTLLYISTQAEAGFSLLLNKKVCNFDILS